MAASAVADPPKTAQWPAYYHHIDGLLFKGKRPVEKEELLQVIRKAARDLGVEPDSIEVIAGGYLVGPGPATPGRPNVKYWPDPS
jgi:hypothetical protein